MPFFEMHSRAEVPVREAYDWHTRPEALERLTPPWESVRVRDWQGGFSPGATMRLEIGCGPFRLPWLARLERVLPGHEFVDVQVRGPFAAWEHTHRFLAEGDEATRLVDEVRYRLPLGWLGGLVAGGVVQARLVRAFRYRHRLALQDLVRHKQMALQPRLGVALSGAGGLVGSQLALFLATGGHTVVRLVRQRPPESSPHVYWNPDTGEFDSASLEGIDAVVHLAGASIARPWTEGGKALIRRSRVEGTRLLCQGLASMARPPRVLVCASAVGFYGHRGDELLTEDSPPGQGFLAQVCQEWEEAAAEAARAGIRVVHLRIGMVLSGRGGALAALGLPFRLGLGGVLGTGEQFVSWISLEDLLGAIYLALYREDLRGPVNAVAPHPITNREMTRILGRVLGRPTLLPLPAPLVRALLGQMGQEVLLSSLRVQPTRLQAAGFEFFHPTFEEAVRVELGRA
jgi:uncharacterized protein (TIGR01777 family)